MPYQLYCISKVVESVQAKSLSLAWLSVASVMLDIDKLHTICNPRTVWVKELEPGSQTVWLWSEYPKASLTHCICKKHFFKF